MGLRIGLLKQLAPVAGVALAAVLAVSCTGGEAPPRQLVVDTLPDGRVVVSSHPSIGEDLRLRETLRIGQDQGTGPRVLGDVADVVLGPTGRIYVAESFSHEIRAFDEDGRFLWRAGEEGGGPEEFRMISGMAWHPAGEIWIRDPANGRITVLGTTGEFTGSFPRRRGKVVSLPWTGQMDSSGRLYEEEAGREAGGRSVVRYRKGTGDELVPDERFSLPEVDVDHFTRRSGEIVERSPVPYSPRIVWAADPSGDVWFGSTDTYRLHRVTPGGDTVRTVELRREAPAIPDWERDSLAEATGLSSDQLPETRPVLRWFTVDQEGRLWVLPARGPGDPPVVDVFGPDGRYRGEARLEAEILDSEDPVLPSVRNRTVVAVVRDDRTGLPSIVRLRLVRPGGEEPRGGS